VDRRKKRSWTNQADIQSDKMYDYHTNVDGCPKWQTCMRERQPPLLVTWGTFDPSSIQARWNDTVRRCPRRRSISLDAGHFALDRKSEEIAAFVGNFMKKNNSIEYMPQGVKAL
jgi:pimeloyl-ACP methyl ester carboxylesterase